MLLGCYDFFMRVHAFCEPLENSWDFLMWFLLILESLWDFLVRIFAVLCFCCIISSEITLWDCMRFAEQYVCGISFWIIIRFWNFVLRHFMRFVMRFLFYCTIFFWDFLMTFHAFRFPYEIPFAVQLSLGFPFEILYFLLHIFLVRCPYLILFILSWRHEVFFWDLCFLLHILFQYTCPQSHHHG